MGTLDIQLFPDGEEVWRDIRKTGVVPQDAGAVTTLFTVTGDVIVKIFAVAKASMTSGSAITVEVGVSGNTAVLIAQIADAKDLVINEIWQDATPTNTVEAVGTPVADGIIISNGQDIILTPSGTFTAGSCDYYVSWKPLSVDGNVVVA